MVELRGIEPLSKNCPTFKRLQFVPLIDKTVRMTTDYPLTELICKIVGISLQSSASPYSFMLRNYCQTTKQ